MSRIIPPIISSSPPPLDGANDDDEEDDDEFGNFTGADSNYDITVLENFSDGKSEGENWPPVDCVVPSSKYPTSHLNGTSVITPDHMVQAVEFNDHVVQDVVELNICNSPDEPQLCEEDDDTSEELQTYVDDRNVPGHKSDEKCEAQDNTSQDSVLSVTDSGLCSASQHSTDASPLPGTEDDFITDSKKLDLCSPGDLEDSSGSDDTLVRSQCETEPKSNQELVLTVTDGPRSDSAFKSSFVRSSEEPPGNSCDIEITKCETDCLPSSLNFQSENAFPINSCSDSVSAISLPKDTACSSEDLKLSVGSVSDSACDKTLQDHSKEDNTYRSKETLSEEAYDEFGDFSSGVDTFESAFSTVNTNNDAEHKQLGTDSDEGSDFGEFTNFESSRVPSNAEDACAVEGGVCGGGSDFTAFDTFPSTSHEGEGASWAEAAKTSSVPVEVLSDEDEFETFESASIQSRGSTAAENSEQLSLRWKTLVQCLFESSSDQGCSSTPAILQPLLVTEDRVWENLADVEETNALTYQWSSSDSNRVLMQSVGVDVRNIIFGPKWNPSVPRFAANLGFGPLEPMKASKASSLETSTGTRHKQESAPQSPKPNRKVQVNDKNEEVIPPAQFDWSSSGLTNPLDGLEGPILSGPKTKKNATTETSNQLLQQFLGPEVANHMQPSSRKPLSADAKRIVEAIPDLSFLRSSVLMFPLRLHQSET